MSCFMLDAHIFHVSASRFDQDLFFFFIAKDLSMTEPFRPFMGIHRLNQDLAYFLFLIFTS